jgi:hypothetical protein
MQRIALVAPNNLAFEDSVAATKNIQQVFSMGFPSNSMKAWTPMVIDGFSAIDFATRYLAVSTTAGSIPIPQEIDPNGVLRRICRDNVRYTAENIVKFHERVTDDDGRHTYALLTYDCP